MTTKNIFLDVCSNLQVKSEKILFNQWRQIIQREVLFPDGKARLFHISNARPAVLVLPWCTKTKTMTLLREYCPGPNSILYTTVSGYFEEKHANIEECARWETEEEAQLSGGQLVSLLEEGSFIPASKYAAQAFYPFLLLDAEKASNPRLRDDDELIEPVYGVCSSEIQSIIDRGIMPMSSAFATLMAFQKLKNMGEL